MAIGGLLSQIAPQILQQLGGQNAPQGLIGGAAQTGQQVLAGAFQGQGPDKARGKKPIAAALTEATRPMGLLEQFKSAFPQVAEAVKPAIQQGNQDRRERLRAMMRAGSITAPTASVGGFTPQPVNFTGLLGG